MAEIHRENSSQATFPGVGVVVIGRNEGERLQRCLESIARHNLPTVYVDSGSTDESVRRASAMGAEIVCLNVEIPFTAGRARSEGFERLMEIYQDVVFVQFVDGDCELVDGWLSDAMQFLNSHEDAAIVCGRRKERYPERSIYNALCDIEWDTSVGEAESSGGDFLARVEAFAAVGGFNRSLVAGEEPDLCYRMRRIGWKIHRLDSLMTLHDANITRFGQWARRSSRAGYAYAARAFLHWRDFNGYCLREVGRALFWGLVFPLAVIASSIALSPWFAVLLLAYVLQYWRVYRLKAPKYAARAARAYALFTVLSKWTELYGMLMFLGRMIGGKEQRIIEYK